MFRDLLVRVESTVLHRPVAVLAVAAAVTLIAVWLGSGIELRTSRRELTPADDPAQARWDRFREEFNGPEPMIVAVEALDDAVPTERLEQVVAAAAAVLEDDPLVSRLFYRVDVDWLGDHLLWLAEPEEIERSLETAEQLLGGADGVLRIGGLAQINERIAGRLEASLGDASGVGSRAEIEARRLVELMRAQVEFFRDPATFIATLAETPMGLADATGRGLLTRNGFLTTDDERVLFLLIGLAAVTEPLDKQRELVALTRVAVEQAIGENFSIGYGLTGGAAIDVEEMASLARDGRRTSTIASLGVLLFALLAFGRRRHALLGLVTLAAGVAWAIGAVRVELGYLNMITTALIPILVGMGIDFAVHPLSQYEIERRTRGRDDAVRTSFRKTSPAVVISALTTAAAFFCFLFMDFRGFSELGLVTGVGVLLCLVAALVALPAMLVVWGDGGTARAAPMDRVWTGAVARRLCAAPRASVAVAAGLTVAAAWGATGVELETDLLELLPASAESLRTLEIVNHRSPLAAEFNVVVADDEADLQRFEARAAVEPTIRRFESLTRFVPRRPEASASAIERARDALDRVVLDPDPFDPARTPASLVRLEHALADAADAAFVTGRGALAGFLEQARGLAEQAEQLVAEAGPRGRWAEGETALVERLRTVIAELRVAAAARAPTIESLPDAIRARFITDTGRRVAYLLPAGDIYDPGFLDRFNAASFRVSEQALGFPILFAAHSRLITSGFGLALGVGGILVCLLLLADLRSVRHAALALVPVIVGTTWMLGLMRALDLPFNLANLVSVPIVLGVGIDAGVHVVHRLRQRPEGGVLEVLQHTGRAILIASLTTMVGFGSLGLAAHRGMASLGMLLLVGVGACMIAALWALPNLLLALGMSER